MSLLGIRNGQYKGVYTYDTRDEYNSVAPIVKGSSMRRFQDEELEAALKWADVAEAQHISIITSGNFQAYSPTPAPAKSSGLDLNSFMAAAGMSVEYVCTQCGEKKNSFSKFCTECGGPMIEFKPTIEEPVVEESTPIDTPTPASEPVTSEWTCSQGHINTSNSSFCTECGERKPAPVVTQPTPKPSPAPAPTPAPTPVKNNVPPTVKNTNKTKPIVSEPVPTPDQGTFDFNKSLSATASNNKNKKKNNNQPVVKNNSVNISKSSEPSEGELISVMRKYSQEGLFKEIIISVQQLDVPLLRIETVSGQELFIILRNMYYASSDIISSLALISNEDNSNVIPDEDAISRAITNNQIKSLKKSWLFPRDKYLLTDFYCTYEDFSSSEIFNLPKSSSFIIENSVFLIEGALAPDEIDGYNLITNPALIRTINQLLS